MYAIINTGGKQYRVEKDEVIDVEIIGNNEGSEVVFNEVLYISDGSTPKIGKPNVSGGVVKGVLLGNVRGRKIDSMKYKRRKGQRTRWGHRQGYSRVKITEIAC